MRRAAAIDPGTSINSFALAIGEEIGDLWRPLILREWRGTPGKPLDLRLREGPEAAALVRAAGLDSWATDQYEWASIQHVSTEHGLLAWCDNEPLEISFRHARQVHNGQRAALWRPDDLDLDVLCEQLAEELQGITEKRRPGGKAEIVLPVSGRRHADLARAWIRMLRWARAGDPTPPPHAYDVGYGLRGHLGTGLSARTVR